ncbi:MAG: peroxiredoxin [Bacteroidia bacterium]|nr:peroxiredoxin [Bacteroidia bacterium]MCX7763301.1 peroxiredoxin [Bacteroidia bacterium]MDW8058254.1 peroxiredoxin [Bacteroidia bacterium]
MRQLAALVIGVSATHAQVGREVPPTLSAPDETGRIVSFGALRGQWVVLFFYPHDDTPGCTRQAKEFSRLHSEFQRLGAQVYGVSTQSSESHRAFKKKHNLTVPLLVDENGKLSDFFGVKRLMGLCSRDVVVINPQGMVALFRQGVSPDTSPKEILAWLKSNQNSGEAGK